MWRQEVDEEASIVPKMSPTEEGKAGHFERLMHALVHGHAVLAYRVLMS